jgi:hypothetical protein
LFPYLYQQEFSHLSHHYQSHLCTFPNPTSAMVVCIVNTEGVANEHLEEQFRYPFGPHTFQNILTTRCIQTELLSFNIVPTYKKLSEVSEVRTASIALMMEAVCTFETSFNYSVITWRYIPEDTKLHTRHCKNLKSHILCISSHI